jgi:hypothetical protein
LRKTNLTKITPPGHDSTIMTETIKFLKSLDSNRLLTVR